MAINYVPPNVRAHLIAGSLKFVLAASRLSGITHIALVGSLTTNKKNPNDANLLVTV